MVIILGTQTMIGFVQKEKKMKEVIVKLENGKTVGYGQEIIRCENCVDCREDGYCERWHITVKKDFFCADGE